MTSMMIFTYVSIEYCCQIAGILCCAKGRAPSFFEILKRIMKKDILTSASRTPDVRVGLCVGLYKRCVYYG